ncbi:MAG: T9SS type A sorting domain-containing protein [Dysgonamonadaceae bacterium]|nr:T9SS type A sorting domain-containing protein [Dysgonamonadaceae bacterium]
MNTATDIRDIGIHPVSVYPNPSNGVFHVQSNDKVNSVSVFDVSGKNILQGKGGDSNLKIDLSKQMPGIYFLTLLTDERMYRSKLVKNSRQL